MENAEITRWTSILDKGIHGPNHATAKDRLRCYLLGSTMNHPQPTPAQKEFYDWADAKLGIVRKAQ